MNICNCLSPVRIPDSVHPGSYIYVPCGKCDVCRNRVSQSWVHRLQVESQCWQYTVFYTLTYDDKNLPCVSLSLVDGVNRLVSISNGTLFDYIPSRKEIPFIRKMRRLSYPNVRDHQLFIKRLRYYLYEYKRKNPFERSISSSLRYFCTYEYGPTTHRIHIHGLLFFNDSKGEFAKEVSSLISQCWANGITDCSFVQSGSASKYVAKYSNVSSSTKGLYASPEFRVRHLQSSNPPIGSLLVNTQTLRQLYDAATPIFRYELSDGYHDGALPLYIKDRLWPKIPDFDRLTFAERVSIYSIAKWSKCESADEFVDWFYSQVDVQYHLTKDFSPVFQYFYRLYDSNNIHPMNGLKRVFRMSKRVLTQCDIFKVSLRDYLVQLNFYYQNVSCSNLSKMYSLQESSQRSTPAFPIQCWPSLDSEFMRIIENEKFENIPEWVLMSLDGYGLDPIRYCLDKRYRSKYDARNYPLWQSYVSKVNKMYQETTKIKSKKEYERTHGFSLINKYYAKYF